MFGYPNASIVSHGSGIGSMHSSLQTDKMRSRQLFFRKTFLRAKMRHRRVKCEEENSLEEWGSQGKTFKILSRLDVREFSRTAPTGFRPVEIVGDRLKSYKSVPTARTFLWVNGAVNGQTLFSGRILPAKPRGLVLGSRVCTPAPRNLLNCCRVPYLGCILKKNSGVTPHPPTLHWTVTGWKFVLEYTLDRHVYMYLYKNEIFRVSGRNLTERVPDSFQLAVPKPVP